MSISLDQISEEISLAKHILLNSVPETEYSLFWEDFIGNFELPSNGDPILLLDILDGGSALELLQFLNNGYPIGQRMVDIANELAQSYDAIEEEPLEEL